MRTGGGRRGHRGQKRALRGEVLHLGRYLKGELAEKYPHLHLHLHLRLSRSRCRSGLGLGDPRSAVSDGRCCHGHSVFKLWCSRLSRSETLQLWILRC